MKLHSLETCLEQQAIPQVHFPGETSMNHEDPSKVVFVKVTNIGFQLKPVCLDVPHFNGADPYDWIFKAQEFFDYHNISEAQ